MENKNKVWFFGDSFTQNLAVKSDGNYQRYKQKKMKTWTESVSHFLNMDEIIVAKGGESSQSIYFSVINNFNNFKSGDWVIATNSPYVRTVGVDFEKKIISTFNNEQIVNVINTDKGSDITCGLPIDEKNIKTLIDYVYTFILPYEDVWNDYWVQNFNNLKFILKEKNVNYIFWDYKLWSEFSSITEETDGKVIDDHWGEDGNRDFSEYIINRIKNMVENE
jgi:hypothetical protein